MAPNAYENEWLRTPMKMNGSACLLKIMALNAYENEENNGFERLTKGNGSERQTEENDGSERQTEENDGSERLTKGNGSPNAYENEWLCMPTKNNGSARL